VPENRDQGNFLNGTVKKRIVAVFIGNTPPSPYCLWPLHDIAATNIVWRMAYKGRVGGGAYIAQ